MDLRVVDRRVVAAAGEGDLVAGLAEQLGGRLLQAAGGDAEFEDARSERRTGRLGGAANRLNRQRQEPEVP